MAMAQWVRVRGAGIGKLVGDAIHLHGGKTIFAPGNPTGKLLSLNDSAVRLDSPFEPRSIIALWNNFHERAAKEGQNLPDFPLYFMKPTSSVIGPQDVIRRPRQPAGGEPVRVIYEAELGVVIGKECNEISEEEAADHVFGYTCVNDVTAPKILFGYESKVSFQQWSRSKGYNTFTPVGPSVTTGINPDGLQVQTILDGEVMQDYPVSDMVFSPMKTISMLSHVQTLLPGDLISLGTSVGAGPMESGQRVEINIPGVGNLSNTFADYEDSKH